MPLCWFRRTPGWRPLDESSAGKASTTSATKPLPTRASTNRGTRSSRSPAAQSAASLARWRACVLPAIVALTPALKYRLVSTLMSLVRMRNARHSSVTTFCTIFVRPLWPLFISGHGALFASLDARRVPARLWHGQSACQAAVQECDGPVRDLRGMTLRKPRGTPAI